MQELTKEQKSLFNQFSVLHITGPTSIESRATPTYDVSTSTFGDKFMTTDVRFVNSTNIGIWSNSRDSNLKSHSPNRKLAQKPAQCAAQIMAQMSCFLSWASLWVAYWLLARLPPGLRGCEIAVGKKPKKRMSYSRKNNLKRNLLSQRKKSEVFFKQFATSCVGGARFVKTDDLKKELTGACKVSVFLRLKSPRHVFILRDDSIHN